MPQTFPPLPILDVLPALRAALSVAPNAVLQAPPGAGKTTLVPIELRHEPWLRGAKIIMLEPRRLAARAAAHRMAQLLGERVGDTVGYRVRRDTQVGRTTRIEVVTEGVLTRMLNSDPTLEDVGLVIFDEFHERSLHADLGLALTLHSQRLVRPDLRILIMSATLDGAPVARLLGDATVVSSEGRMFDVDIRYLPRRPDQWLEPSVASAIRVALEHTSGDVLVFLPGQREIHRVADLLDSASFGSDVDVHPLYGNLPFEAQDRAIAPAPSGRRKVVLATSIAESSLTIEGVRCVVDSGVSRVPRFSPAIGMTRLETIRVSHASSTQRAGRAGRVAPGVCYRLWAMEEQAGLVPFTAPEIVDADLAPLALELAAAGIERAAELAWLDVPPAAALARAHELLRWLGALDGAGRLTPHGARMAALAAHPRISHMLLRAHDAGDGALSCDLAALIGERDVLRSEGPQHDADLHTRLELMRASRKRERIPERVGGMRVVRDGLARVVDEAAEWRGELDEGRRVTQEGIARETDADVGRVLALAYPDRVAQRRPGEGRRYLLRNGQGALLRDSPALATAPYLVVAESDGKRPESAIYLAAPIELSDIIQEFSHDIEQIDQIDWDEQTQSVRASRIERLGAITLREVPTSDPSPTQLAATLLEAVRASQLQMLHWSEGAERLRERMAFVHASDSTWPDVSQSGLLESLHQWLAPRVMGMRRAADVYRLDLHALLLERLSWQQRAALDALAPTHYVAPTGNHIRIDYADAAAPAVHIRLQEMFGCTETPRVLGGRVMLTLHLLSPAHRPVQVTKDLPGFWRTSYFDVKKEMKGRYPKHHWPDDPLAATPTQRVKPRGS